MIRRTLIALLVFSVLSVVVVFLQPDLPVPETAPLPPPPMPLLTEDTDGELQEALADMVRAQGLWPAVEQGRLALAMVIVTDPLRPRLAELNGHKMMYAASLPKIAILFGAAVAVQEGRLPLDAALRKDMVDMIRYSCNDCATRVLERVGREELIALLQAPDYRFYDPEDGGGLWVGKDYAPRPAYHRDPVYQLSHGANAYQVARFYYMLATDTLVGPESTRLMRNALSRPGIRHKFVQSLGAIPGLQMLRKSGTWREFHSDSALVRYRGESYIIVGLAQDENGGKWLTSLARPMHELAMAQARQARHRIASL
jgi:beta-lactamase class A